MAALMDLLARLHAQGWDLIADHHPSEDLDSYRRTWLILSRHAGRAVAHVGGDYTPVARLVDPMGEDLQSGGLNRQLAGLSMTVGAIADLLVIRQGEVDRHGPEARARVQASVLAAVYAAARVTAAAAQAADRPDVAGAMRQVSGLTEVAAMAPPHQLRSSLDFVAVPDSDVHSVDGALRAWKQQAFTTLDSPWLVTEHALRSTAGDIHYLLQAAGQALDRAVDAGVVSTRSVGDARAQLGLASTAWRSATQWPQHLRLGGRSVSLRQAASYLRQALDPAAVNQTDPAAHLAAMGSALVAAQGVAVYHARALGRLVRRGGLWVHGSHLTEDEPARAVARRHGWAVKPTGSQYGQSLLNTSTQAQKALVAATQMVLSVPIERGFDGRPARWEAVAAPRIDQRRDQAQISPPRPPSVAR